MAFKLIKMIKKFISKKMSIYFIKINIFIRSLKIIKYDEADKIYKDY